MPNHYSWRRVSAFLGVPLLGLLGLSGCAAPQSNSDQAAPQEITIVSSLNVYADIASVIGGDQVKTSALISNTAEDPHSYEAKPQDRVAIEKAQLVIKNGGGYDEFLSQLTKDKSAEQVLDVAKVSGLDSTEEGHTHAPGESHDQAHDTNEHFWYSLPAMKAVAEETATKLSKVKPDSAQEFQGNAQRFTAELQELQTRVDQLKSTYNDQPVAVTEVVPLYLLEAIGLKNKTPAAFSSAVESDSDIPVAALTETRELLTNRSVRLLAYNTQTATSQTESIVQTALDSKVPVVEFTESLPEGERYSSWMGKNISQLTAALQQPGWEKQGS